MTAQELFEQYRNLNRLEAIKFDILFQEEAKLIEKELQKFNVVNSGLSSNIEKVVEIIEDNSNLTTARVYKIPVSDKNSVEVKAILAETLNSYKEEIYIPESIPEISFTIDDIKDKDRLDRMIEKEAKAIYESSVGRKGRDYDSVRTCVLQGKVAELWLIENMDFDEAGRKYHDLVNKKGEFVEVKAYSNVWSVDAPFVQTDLRKIRTEGWNKSKWYYLFKYDYGTYTLLNIVKL